MAAGVYALPCNDRLPLDELLADLALQGSVVHMQARAEDAATLQKLVMTRWKLSNLRQRYQKFTSQYRVVQNIMRHEQKPTEHSLFLLRVLLIHEYRRILLSDPELPTAMLPTDWEGYAAQSLTGEIYRGLAKQTKQWVNRELLNANGHMNGGSNTLQNRFPN